MIAFPRPVHLRFDHDIVSCSVTVRSILPVSCNASVDQAWIHLRKCRVVHAIFLERAWEVVFHEYITLLC
jgi:hypothetical protein